MKNIQISDELHKQLKTHCAEQGLLMRFYVEKLIANELAKTKSVENKPNTSK